MDTQIDYMLLGVLIVFALLILLAIYITINHDIIFGSNKNQTELPKNHMTPQGEP